MPEEKGTYVAAGVDIDEAQRALRSVRDAIIQTHSVEVLGGIGGFGALFEPNFANMDRPILVSSVDGVGTKTKIAAMVADFSNIGKDIVNHCVNDILCQGARPLFFLDYFGCSKLDHDVFQSVVTGAASACKAVGCALIGGETAEMPGVYLDGETDIVGCIVGVVDYTKRLPSEAVNNGDRLIGVASNGLHTNGYSLARKVLFDQAGLLVSDRLQGMEATIGQALLEPHRCYFRCFENLLESGSIHALAHITGGGIYDNLARFLPSGLKAVVEKSAWTPPTLFSEIRRLGGIDDVEMYRAFNMGIGIVAVVPQDHARGIVEQLNETGESATIIGELQYGSTDVVLI